MLTVIVLLLYAAVIAFDFVPQTKQPGSRKKDSVVYLALTLLSFAVLLLYSFNIMVPGPSEPISNVIKALFKVK